MRAWMLGLAVAVAGVVALAVFAVVAFTSRETSVVDLEVGDCFDVDLGGGRTNVDTVSVVDCDDAHLAEVVLIGDLNEDGESAYPSDRELFADIDRRCSVVQDDVGDEFGLLPIAPDERTWTDRGGRFSCVAIPFGGGEVTGSLIDNG